jgi:itaconyl-CoA hydratase
MAGRYYEDFEVGATYHHRPGRTLSEADNTWFTLLTMNTHPIHFDAEYAKRTEFGKPLVVSTLTLAVLVGMSVTDTSRNAVANLGWKEIKLPKPVSPATRSTLSPPYSRRARRSRVRTRAS